MSAFADAISGEVGRFSDISRRYLYLRDALIPLLEETRYEAPLSLYETRREVTPKLKELSANRTR